MRVLDNLKAAQCPAAENIISLWHKVGSNGHEEINVALRTIFYKALL